jgi:hypothetical protein
MYKVVIINLPDGTEELEEVFETEEDAREFGLQWCSDYDAGAEVLHMSNKGDYPDPQGQEDVDFEVIKVGA